VTSAQRSLFSEPAAQVSGLTIGSRWRIRHPLDRGHREEAVWQLTALEPEVDPIYFYRLELIEIVSTRSLQKRVGDWMHVEAAWFTKNPYVSAVGGGQ
jgi:hypothetical protein